MLSNARSLTLALTIVPVISTACFDGSDVREEGGVRVFAVRKEFASSFIVEDDGGRVIVDTAYEDNAGDLARHFEGGGEDINSVDAIVLTHGHSDHAGGARFLRGQYGIPVVIGAGDDGILGDGGADPVGLCPTDDFAAGRVEEDGAARYTPFDADVLAKDSGDLSQLSAIDAELVFQPSHTPGALTVVVGPFAFVGDLFRGDIFSSAAAVHFYNCDLEANRREIQALLDNHPDVTTFIPSHFGAVSRDEVEALLERWPSN